MAGPINPVTLAMIGAAGGAALKPNNPLQGALLGATAGFTGGTALGIGAGTTAAGAGTGLTMGANAANAAKLGLETTGLGTGIGSAVPGTMGLGQGLSLTPQAISSASNVSSIAKAASAADALNAASTAPEWFGLGQLGKASTGLTAPAATSGYALAAPVASSAAMAPTLAERLAMAGTSAYENPMMTSQALGATQGLLTPEQSNIPSAPPVPIRAGQLKNYDPISYMDPYKPSVIGNPQVSLI